MCDYSIFTFVWFWVVTFVYTVLTRSQKVCEMPTWRDVAKTPDDGYLGSELDEGRSQLR